MRCQHRKGYLPVQNEVECVSAAGKRHMGIVASLGCVICRRDLGVRTPPEVHHVAEGSGVRSDFMTAGLCTEHHRGKSGLHGLGLKAFLMLYRLASEFHLLELVNKFRAEDGI